MTRFPESGAAFQRNHLYEPSLQRYRFSKPRAVPPARTAAFCLSVRSRSSGCTNSMNGFAISSARVKPRVRSQAGLRRLKWPLKSRKHSMSIETSKNGSTTPLSSSMGIFGLVTRYKIGLGDHHVHADVAVDELGNVEIGGHRRRLIRLSLGETLLLLKKLHHFSGCRPGGGD